MDDIDTLNKIIEEGDEKSFRKNNKKLLKKTDPAAVEEVINEQIELLGSELLYQRINNNLLEHKFEAFFAKEQFKLFAWREKFFFRKFGSIDDDDGMMGWISFQKIELGSTEAEFDTVPYQITMNFKEVTALACSTDYRPNNGSYVFFENDQELSSTAMAMFDPVNLNDDNGCNDLSDDCDCDYECECFLLNIDTGMNWNLVSSGINFKGAAHMIMALYRIGPCTLLESAMKTVLLHRLPIHDIPKELQQKALHGLYSENVEDPVPSDLSRLGRRYFCSYRYVFTAERSSASEDERSSTSDTDDERSSASGDGRSSTSDDEISPASASENSDVSDDED